MWARLCIRGVLSAASFELSSRKAKRSRVSVSARFGCPAVRGCLNQVLLAGGLLLRTASTCRPSILALFKATLVYHATPIMNRHSMLLSIPKA
jgi:hypothetical protein